MQVFHRFKNVGWKAATVLLSLILYVGAYSSDINHWMLLTFPILITLICIFSTWNRRGNLKNFVMSFLYQISAYFVLSVGILADKSLLILGFISMLYIFAGAERVRQL